MKPFAVSEEEIARAASLLRAGGLVAFPTETYYGLAVDPCNEQALARLFRVKRRPAAKPVLVLVPGQEQVAHLAARIPPVAQLLMDRFWPGPLTLVLSAQPSLSPLLTAGTGTVGVRRSPHPFAQALVQAFGAPLTATSANRSGGAPAVNARQVQAAFGDEIDLVLDGGPSPGGAGSTLVGVTDTGLTCIREGRIPFAKVCAAVA